MIKKISLLFCFFVLFFGHYSSAQDQNEREYRILKSQFPEKALDYIQEKLEDVKRKRFYKEVDSTIVSYEIKFKKDRLWYGVTFTKEGVLTGAEIKIKTADIPEETFTKIEAYLATNFSKYKIRKLKQQYPIASEESSEQTINNAFQNMMITDMNYELFVIGTKEGTRDDYEITFDSFGSIIQMSKALPANYDRVLY